MEWILNGSSAITVTADANTLSGTTLKSTVINSSLTSVGTLSSLTMSGALSGVTTLGMSGDLTVDTNTLFVDASEDKVGIGTTSPLAKLHLSGGDSSTSYVNAIIALGYSTTGTYSHFTTYKT